MEQLNGIISDGVPLNGLRKVSDLIYYEGPLLSHFKNKYGDNYLFYWVDNNDNFNRWLVFRVYERFINSYIERSITLKELILSTLDEFLYSIDIDNNLDYKNIQLVKINDLPASYLPKPDSKYNFKPIPSDSLIEGMLSVNSSGLLEASFSKSSIVGYGTMHLEAFSPLIYHMNEISNGLGESYYKLKSDNVVPNEKHGKKKKLLKNEVLSNTMFELIGFMPGSFKLILKPINTQSVLPGEKTEVDNYCDFFLKFIQASYEYSTLIEYINLINKDVITHYEKFLKNIQLFKLEFKLAWVNNSSMTRLEQVINYKSAPKIIDNINRLEYQNSSEFNMIGRFLEINLKTKHYTFQSIADDKAESKGYFDDLLKEGLILIKFNQYYEVKIIRLESKEAGNKEPKTQDKLTAFYDFKDGK
ncbi:DUF6575 domain-containing protein [Chitinophaga silvisoli]|uniref:DUF6575 domain-containing protein n=1 Tax=Chitinophaga silvisoli TaxID=2291814 RepID=A0A3E1NTI3_9BACT|nr:DUF6575 domain-containing protein [Chitinophaga silvisoli]RFM31232.1 hypothetical protein DXN04_29315 [Chitinophaga silvisoli]